MAYDVHTSSEPSMTTLVTGIINDAQELLKQQLTLAKREIQDDLRQTKEAALSLAVGVGLSFLAGILLCSALALLLSWLWPALPSWAGFGIVGGLLAVAGGAFIYAGQQRFESFNPLPDQTVAALRENLRWTTNRR